MIQRTALTALPHSGSRPVPTPRELLEFQSRFDERCILAGGERWLTRDTNVNSAPVVVLLPGAQGTGDIHYRLALRLAKRHVRALAVTPPANANIELLADGLKTVLAVLKLEQVHVYGSSIGGYLAQVFARRHPERVLTLFIGNSFMDPLPSQAKWPALEHIQAQPACSLLEAARRRIKAMTIVEPQQAELRDALLTILGPRQKPEALKARIMSLLNAKPIGTVPLLSSRIVLIDSDDDPVISRVQREDLRNQYAGSPHYEIRGGGHYPSILRPSVLAEAIGSEIARSATPDSGTTPDLMFHTKRRV